MTKKVIKMQIETVTSAPSMSGTAEASNATDTPNATDAQNATDVTDMPRTSADVSNATDIQNATVAIDAPNTDAASNDETSPNTSLDDVLASAANDALHLAKKNALPHVGLGVDVVDIARMERIMKRSPAFIERVFSETERAYCTKNALASAHFAARFAAKEAVVKALGTGFSDGIVVRDVEIVHTAHGRPVVALHGRAKEIADERHICEIPVSLSFTHSHAVACAVCITEEARAARAKDEARPTSHQQLNEQFKQARRMLDDL